MSSLRAAAWPPPTDSDLPEPLRTFMYAYGRTDLRNHVSSRRPRLGRLHAAEPPWKPALRHQLTSAAHGDVELRRGLRADLARLDIGAGHGSRERWKEDPEEAMALLLLDLVHKAGLVVHEPESVPWDAPGRLSTWVRRWVALHPVPAEPHGRDVSSRDLMDLRLGVADLDAVREVLNAAPGGRLTAFAPDHRPYEHRDRWGLTLDLGALAAQFPDLDPVTLTHLVERALIKRHVFGLLDRTSIEELGLTPADHPCGIDICSSETNDALERLGEVLTGSPVHTPMALEWARHEWLDWGEDEDLFFRYEHLAGLRAAMDDPTAVKGETAAHYLDRVIAANLERRAAALGAYRHRPAIDELFDVWRRPPHLVVDPATAVDGMVARLAQQGVLEELTTSLEQIVAASPDDESAYLNLAEAAAGAACMDGPDGAFRAVVLAIRDRVAEFATPDGPLSSVSPHAATALPFPDRSSSFADDSTRERAVQLLTERFDGDIEDFLAGTSGWDHLVLTADLADELGVVGTVTQEPFRRPGQDEPIPVPTGVAVLVLRRADGSDLALTACYPELPLDPAVRQAYPHLTRFFTITYHQDRSAPAGDVARTMRELRNPASSSVREELSLLLHVEDDDEIRRIVRHCGSFLVPHHVRHWVDRLRWRFDAFDWQPDREAPLR